MPIIFKDTDCRQGVRAEVRYCLRANRSKWEHSHYRSLAKKATRICIAAGLTLLTLLPDQHLPKAPDNSPKVESTPAPLPPSALSEFRKTFFNESLDSQLLNYLQTTRSRPPLR